MKYALSIIIPFYNEKENIPRLLETLENYGASSGKSLYEVIFVDDGSTDGSAHTLKEYTPKTFSLILIILSRNFGSHAALRAGIAHAQGAYTTFMCADMQDPVTLIDALYQSCAKGTDIAWGYRRSVPSGAFEKNFSRLYSYLMKRWVNQAYPAHGVDVVMFDQKVKEQLNAHPQINSSIFLQILTMGFTQTCVPYDKQKREHGKSKWTFAKKRKLFLDSIFAFSRAPVDFILACGLMLLCAGIVAGAYAATKAFIMHAPGAGHLFLASIMLCGFGITTVSLGILAEYLVRIFDSAGNKQTYIIREITHARAPQH